MLVERRHLEIDAEPQRAGIRRQRAGQKADQRGLAAAVRADDADAVAALDAGGEVADDRSSVEGDAEAFCFQHHRAGLFRFRGVEVGLAGGALIGPPGLAQRLQIGEPLDVALAPAGDAVAQPVFLGDDLAVELVLVALFLREHLVAPGLELGKTAFDPPRLAAVEPDGGA